MASIVPMSVQDIMDQVYTLVDDDPLSSTTQDDEYTARLRLINAGIGAWQRQDIRWRELWKQANIPTLTSATTYALSGITDFLIPGSLIYVPQPNSSQIVFIDVIKPEDAIQYTNANNSNPAAFITGNASSGWTLNLTFTPTAGDQFYGNTPYLYYYKSANRVSATTDVPEMSDPTYLVYFVAWQKHLFNNRTDMAEDAMAQAQECMDNMRIRNEQVPNYADNRLRDPEMFRWGDALGL